MRSWTINNMTHSNYMMKWKTTLWMNSNYHKFFTYKTTNRRRCIHGPKISIKINTLRILMKSTKMDKNRIKKIGKLHRIIGSIILRWSITKSHFSKFITKVYPEPHLIWPTGTPLREKEIHRKCSQYSKIFRQKSQDVYLKDIMIKTI